MQSSDFKVPVGGSTTVLVPGTGIWFESGTSTTTDPYIIVKPTGGGAEVTLKPGQHFQDATNQSLQWTVTAHDATAAITGRVIVGNGDFGDSNVNGTFNLAGAMTINNLPAAPVPIAAGTGVTLPVSLAGVQQVSLPGTTAAAPMPVGPGTGVIFPVSIAGTVTTTGGPMIYTNSFVTSASINGGVAIVTPAANVNGVIVNQLFITNNGGGFTYSLLAKTTAPASQFDGDMLHYTLNTTVTEVIQPNIKIPAGKGLYLYENGNDAGVVKALLYTIL